MIHNYPELKDAISYPFRSLGDGDQLPAFQPIQHITLAAPRLPLKNKPTTLYHNGTSRQYLLDDSCKSCPNDQSFNI